MHRPVACVVYRAPSFPVHLLPAVGLQDLRPVVRVDGMSAHPVRERQVVHEQRRIVATRQQPGCLSVAIDVEQADRDAVKSVSRRRGQHLAGRDRVSGQKYIPALLLEFERVAHHGLGGSLTPRQRRDRRHRHHIVQLDALH